MTSFKAKFPLLQEAGAICEKTQWPFGPLARRGLSIQLDIFIIEHDSVVGICYFLLVLLISTNNTNNVVLR